MTAYIHYIILLMMILKADYVTSTRYPKRGSSKKISSSLVQEKIKSIRKTTSTISQVLNIGEVKTLHEEGFSNSTLRLNPKLYIEMDISSFLAYSLFEKGQFLSSAIKFPNDKIAMHPFNHAIINFHKHSIVFDFFVVDSELRESWSCIKDISNNKCDASLIANDFFYKLPPSKLYPYSFQSNHDIYEMSAYPYYGLQNILHNEITTNENTDPTLSILTYGGYIVGIELYIPVSILYANIKSNGIIPQPSENWGWENESYENIGPSTWFIESNQNSIYLL